LLAKEIVDPASGQETFGGLDITVRRNAFGNQNDSFETVVELEGLAEPMHVAFIRAPIVESVGDGVEVIARLPSGQIVGVRQQKVIGISFHPEMYGDSRVHQLLIDSI
jgi:5'-phosphate synthase pdxT subunit